MTTRRAEWIEATADTGAAVLFAAAIAIILVQFESGQALSLAVPALAFAGCFYGLRRIGTVRVRTVPDFKPVTFVPVAANELVLTEADRLDRQELLLDRALAHVGPGSRVVQLFDSAAMPTPGELKARIDRHLVADPQAAPPDASQALFEALSDLRRSLR